MRVLLVSANTESINMVTLPVGLWSVAAAARAAGHEVELLDLISTPDPGPAIREAVARFSPAVVGISVRNIDDQSMASTRFLLEKARDTVDLCRAATDAPIVVGGAGYSIFPVPALAYLGADFGVAGDGEETFVALLDRLTRGLEPDLPGVYRRGLTSPSPAAPADLGLLPLPDVSLLSAHRERANEVFVPFQTRRGCPLDCSYCSTSAIEGRRIRRRPLDRVTDSLAAYAAAGFKKFFFTDNTFNLPRRYAADLCSALIDLDLGLTWRCIIYPGKVDADLARLMADAGCREASVGFESGNAEVLRGFNKRFGPEEVRETLRLLGEVGIRRMGFLLLGGPDDTRATVEESLAFVESLEIEGMRLSAGIRIYPATALAEQARAEGVIAPDDDLLRPRFYLHPSLTDWLPDEIKRRAAEHRGWIV